MLKANKVRSANFASSFCLFCKYFQRIQGPVSRKSRNSSGAFRVTYFNLYLQSEGVSRHETLQLLYFLFPLQHMKRPALQNVWVAVLPVAFRARKVCGAFEKWVPDLQLHFNFPARFFQFPPFLQGFCEHSLISTR